MSKLYPEKSTKQEKVASLMIVIDEKHDSFKQHKHFAQKRYHWVDDSLDITKVFLLPEDPIGFALRKSNVGMASTFKENSEWSVIIFRG